MRGQLVELRADLLLQPGGRLPVHEKRENERRDDAEGAERERQQEAQRQHRQGPAAVNAARSERPGAGRDRLGQFGVGRHQ